MGDGYVRQSAADILPHEEIGAAPLNNEFNAIEDAFDGTTGHSHDGSAGEGPKINLETSVVGLLPIVNGGYTIKNKYDATVNPTATNDSTEGYSIGSIWVNVTADTAFVAVDVTTDTAIWSLMTLSFSDLLVSFAGLSVVSGDIIYGSATDTVSRLPKGSDGSFLALISGIPAWATVWSNVPITSGGTISFDNGDVVITHGANALAFTGASSGYSFDAGLKLPSGGTIDFSAGDVVITHSSNTLAFSGASSGYTFDVPIALASGGTGSNTAAGARGALGLGSAAVMNETTTAEFLANTADRVLSTDQVNAAGAALALTSGTTINWNMALGFNASVTLAHNATLVNPTNAIAGRSGAIVITQDGTGNRTLAFGTNWEAPAGMTPPLSTTAGTKDIIFYWNQSSNTHIITGILRALS